LGFGTVKAVIASSAWKDLNHSDGLDEVKHLGVKTNNSIIPIGKGQPFSVEDMSISNIVSQSQLIMWRQFDNTQAAGSLLMQWAVAPWNVPCTEKYQYTDPTGDHGLGHTSQATNMHTYASFMSNCFNYWRGTCVVDVHVIAQAFSKAYLGFTWIPGDSEAMFSDQAPYPVGGSVVLSDLANFRTHVVEVDGNTESSFEIPFLCPEYYLNSSISMTDILSTNGTLLVYVINPLTSFSIGGGIRPIDVLVNVGWKDFEFARPSTHDLMNTGIGGQLYCDILPNDVVEDELELQSGEFFGETINEICDLTRRPTYLAKHKQTNDLTQDTVIVSLFSNMPYNVQTVSPDVLIYGPNKRNKSRPPLGPACFANYISRIYLTWRGEVTYTVLSIGESYDDGNVVGSESMGIVMANVIDRSTVQKAVNTPISGSDNARAVVTTPMCTAFGAGATYRPVNLRAMPASATVPYYSPRAFMLTPDIFGPSGSEQPCIVTSYEQVGVPGVRISSTAAKDTTFMVYCNTADSFSYGMLYPPAPSLHGIAPGVALIGIKQALS